MKNIDNKSRKLSSVRRPPSPALRLSPTAWAKLLYLRDRGDTEVGGFGICAADDLLYVEDVQLVEQTCTCVSVAFDDASVADFFDQQVDRGLRPERFARIWVHTHPGMGPQPSGTDEETFQRVFGKADWAVMFILARECQTYARLSFHVGPGGSLVVPVEVDYSRSFAASDQDAWEQEYLANVRVASPPLIAQRGIVYEPGDEDAASTLAAEQDEWSDAWDEFLDGDQALFGERLCHEV